MVLKVKFELSVELIEVLVELKERNATGACRELQDFINIVSSERGRHIPVSIADRWIAAAGQIQAAIPCGQSQARIKLDDRPPSARTDQRFWFDKLRSPPWPSSNS